MNTRLTLVQKLELFMDNPEHRERIFTGEESKGVDDSWKFKQKVNGLVADGLVKATRDIEGNITVEKMEVVKGASLSVSTPSLQQSDDASAAVQKTPNRVSLDSMKAKIASVEYLNPTALPTMNICVIMLQNGFSLVGKSAPADPDNYNAELGRQFAYEDALRQMWPLEAYLLREQMSGA